MKEQKIYQNINELFQSILRKKASGEIKKFFDFQKGNPQHAPFNNALVFAQNPECVYYMTASQWEKRFTRSIREGARPMVVLFPFGPVDFVYDFKQTEGDDKFDENSCVEWWREEKSNILSAEIINTTIRHLDKKYQIPFVSKNPKEYFGDHSLSTGGYARSYRGDGRPEITLHPRYATNINARAEESYGVLVHEIAHIFLGHLGAKHYLEGKNEKKTERQLCEDRSYLDRKICELEAELTAWLVFNRFGIEKHSVDYLAGWLVNDEDWQEVNFSIVMRVANTIFEMKNR